VTTRDPVHAEGSIRAYVYSWYLVTDAEFSADDIRRQNDVTVVVRGNDSYNKVLDWLDFDESARRLNSPTSVKSEDRGPIRAVIDLLDSSGNIRFTLTTDNCHIYFASRDQAARLDPRLRKWLESASLESLGNPCDN
jgi:hypothetical protein